MQFYQSHLITYYLVSRGQERSIFFGKVFDPIMTAEEREEFFPPGYLGNGQVFGVAVRTPDSIPAPVPVLIRAAFVARTAPQRRQTGRGKPLRDGRCHPWARAVRQYPWPDMEFVIMQYVKEQERVRVADGCIEEADDELLVEGGER